MADVLVQMDAPAHDGDGRAYRVRVCGREAEDGLWEGWIEFDPEDGGEVLRTPRETKQPNRPDLEYWAGGLSPSYVEGALQRALHPPTAERRPREGTRSGPRPRHGGAVLDPFEAYAHQGEAVLREELGALDEDHLRSVVRSYHLAAADEPDLRSLPHRALVERIVSSVRGRAGRA